MVGGRVGVAHFVFVTVLFGFLVVRFGGIRRKKRLRTFSSRYGKNEALLSDSVNVGTKNERNFWLHLFPGAHE